MIRRSEEGGIILSDDEQRAVVACLIYEAIEQFLDEGRPGSVPQMAEGAWDSVADDLGLAADAHLSNAHSIADAFRFDLDDLMAALTEPEDTP